MESYTTVKQRVESYDKLLLWIEIIGHIIYSGTVIYFFIHFETKSYCIKPIYEWLEIQIGLSIIHLCFRIFCLMSKYCCKKYFKPLSLTFLTVNTFANAFWLIVGSMWLFSPDNDCGVIKETKPYNKLTFILLILGYIKMSLFIVFFILVNSCK